MYHSVYVEAMENLSINIYKESYLICLANLFLCDLYDMTLFIASISATIDCYLVELQTLNKTTPYI